MERNGSAFQLLGHSCGVVAWFAGGRRLRLSLYSILLCCVENRHWDTLVYILLDEYLVSSYGAIGGENDFGIVRFHSIAGICNDGNAGTLGGIGVGVRSKRFIFIINTSNTNGDAFLGLVVRRRGPADNAIVINSCSSSAVGGGRIPCCEEAVNVIFRSFHLVPGVDICSGITFTVHIVNTGRGSVEGHIPCVLRLINLSRGTHSVPGRLSNNRRRHISLTETLMGGPGLVVTSRPANGISPRVDRRVIRVLAGVGGNNAAIVVIARRRDLIHTFPHHIVIVGGNRIISSAPSPSRTRFRSSRPRGSASVCFFGRSIGLNDSVRSVFSSVRDSGGSGPRGSRAPTARTRRAVSKNRRW